MPAENDFLRGAFRAYDEIRPRWEELPAELRDRINDAEAQLPSTPGTDPHAVRAEIIDFGARIREALLWLRARGRRGGA